MGAPQYITIIIWSLAIVISLSSFTTDIGGTKSEKFYKLIMISVSIIFWFLIVTWGGFWN